MIRTYENRDATDIIELLNKKDSIKINNHIFNQITILDNNFDKKGFNVAEIDGEIIGAIYILNRKYPYLTRGLEKEKAWIQFFVVKKGYEKNEIVDRLIKITLDKFSDTKEIIFGEYSPSYLYPGISSDFMEEKKILKNHGFVEESIQYRMSINLIDFKFTHEIKILKEKREEEGFKFFHLNESRLSDLLYFINNEFSVGWYINVKDSIRKIEDYKNILIVEKDEKIIGYVQSAFDGDIHRFGPFGIGKDYRNYQLGTILIYEKLLDAKSKGIESMYFKSTEENGRRFYERIGFKVDKEYRKFKLEK